MVEQPSIDLRPSSVSDLSRALADLQARRQRVDLVDLAALDHILDYHPEDMTVTVETGISLSHLNSRLSLRRQWLPIDPPEPELPIQSLLGGNVSGPRQLAYGSWRNYVLGVRVVLADGTVIRSGGKVVKNVAGYDLLKLFIGARQSLGVVVEATFKLRPIPEAEEFLQMPLRTLSEVETCVESVAASNLDPVILDCHNLPLSPNALRPLGRTEPASRPVLTLIIGFAGTAEGVACQTTQAKGLGFHSPTSLDYDRSFRKDAGSELRQISVLPSRLTEQLKRLGPVPFVARAGSGLIYYRGPAHPELAPGPHELHHRLKKAFDPHRTLPDLIAPTQ